MSQLAREEFDNARIRQTTQNDARRIRQRVVAAQDSPHRAGIRWPFELIQNAHDAGPRDSDERIGIHFSLCDGQLVVSHTGKSFVAQELAALLSGGSSKEFDSKETTGRFGTGFLVTHALSTQVDVDGVLTTQQGSECFQIKLIRDGDEDSIVKNIELANQSLERAEAVGEPWISTNPTASFTYHNPNADVVRRGLERLEKTLPYLYATCSKLGRVEIDQCGEKVDFEFQELHKRNKGSFIITETKVNRETSEGVTCYTAVRIGREGKQSALLVVLENNETDKHRVLLPSQGFARVFVTFPIAGTDHLPFNVVFDGKFAPRQERDGIAMHNGDKALIDEALSAFPVLVQHAVESDWRNAHELAHLAVPPTPLSGETESGELVWWENTISRAAKETAAKPIVQTKAEFLPALHGQNGQSISFLVPSIRANATKCMDYDTFHDIAAGITELNLPSKEIAESWGEIARQWDSVGVTVERLGFEELTDWLKAKGDSIDDLPINGDRFSWIARLFLLASEMNDQNVSNSVNGLLPDQNGLLRNTKTDYLYRDSGISREIKDIGCEIDKDFRSELLHITMAKALTAPGYEGANDLASDLLDDKDGGEYTEAKAIETIIESLDERFPEDSLFDEDTDLSALRASARLAAYLAEKDDVQRIRRCPLLTAAGSIVRLSGNQQILAPATYWPASARPYVDLYKNDRLLSDRYSDDHGLAGVLDKLIAVGLVIAAPLFTGRRATLSDIHLLREMSDVEQDITDVSIRDTSFGQIAFLATDLVQRCGQDRELAKLLLDFVLNVAAREDQSWRETRSFSGIRSGERVDLTLYRAVWPFELKVRSWIPVERPDSDGIVPMPADESNLQGILEKSWLNGNRDAVDLLHQVFGFRRLTLMLESLDTEIESDLVELLQDPELVKAAAASPDAVKFASGLEATDITLDSVQEFVKDMEEDENLSNHLANRREQRRRVRENQNLGGRVENLVKKNLKKAGFSVRRTGVGSDFEIALDVGDLANLKLTRDRQTWLVEVKATRDQRVRMTDTQATTAVEEGERYLLCVVPVESGNDITEVDDIRDSMRFVAGIGDRVSKLCSDLGGFEEIRDDITAEMSSGVQLEITPGPARVRVFSSVWENVGFPLDELATRLTRP